MSKKFNPFQRLRTENSLEDVLGILKKEYKWEAAMDKIDVKQAWKNLMGPVISNYTQEVLLQREVLYVSLTSAVLREELSYGKDKIIHMLNEELKKPLIRSIVFR